MYDAVVVGAGPNGLAAAITIAEAGRSVLVLEARDEIGGGARSAELTLPGLVHDICSATHPFAAASPFFRRLPLDEYGLEFVHPEVPFAQPLDGGRAGAVHRSLDETAAAFGVDGARWRTVFEPLVASFDAVVEEALRPVLHFPRHPVELVRFGLRALLPATTLGGTFRTPEARAAFAGAAAHAINRLDRPFMSAIGLLMVASAHAVGWPVAKGGSSALAEALARYLRVLGGEIETGVEVRAITDLPRCRVALLDLTPQQLLQIAGDRVPPVARRQFRRFRRGPGAFKLDLAVEGGVPWTAEVCRRAGTVHVGGPMEEIADAERQVTAGRMPTRPVMLLGQQYLADPGRSQDGVHPVWLYAHVPHGYDGDAEPAMLDQLERFAPGTRERIVETVRWRPADLEAYNANYVGGDIAGGAATSWQALVRPRLHADPYWTGVPGLYLCSASTPPGAGVHGMCGRNAAASALRALGERLTPLRT